MFRLLDISRTFKCSAESHLAIAFRCIALSVPITSAILLPSVAAAAQPLLRVLSLGAREQVHFFQEKLSPPAVFEQPPRLVVGPESYVFSTTSYSWGCQLGDGLFSSDHIFSKPRCIQVSGPARNAVPASGLMKLDDWRLSYDGVAGGAAIHLPSGQIGVVTVDHGENKNEDIAGHLYQNSINLNVKAANCASGFAGGSYHDCWPSYNGFIGWHMLMKPEIGSWEGFVNVDRGPLVWPTMGYIDGKGSKLTSGVRHPNTLQTSEYLYVFFTDTSNGSEPGRQGGLEVARAPLTALPNELTAVNNFENRFDPSNTSLPKGFDGQRTAAFFSARGGRASELWPSSHDVISFAVAKVRNTPYYVGIAECLRDRDWWIELRASDDLIHWSTPIPLKEESTSQDWNSGLFHYPVLLDERGENEQTIDAPGFWVVGTDSHASVWRIHIGVTLK